MARLIPIVLLTMLISVGPANRVMATPRYVNDMGYGLAAFSANLLYVPAKFVYGIGGGLVGAMAYGLTVGNFDVAQSIWSPSMGGTWVLSSEMMSGEKPILFSGETCEASGR